MGRPEDHPPGRSLVRPPRYGRYVAVLALVILGLITINTIVTKPHGAAGVPPGDTLPPFAVPLARGTLEGDADVATRADQGAQGRIPACHLRGPQILNICELYEQGPVVLALFINGGSCPHVLTEMQSLVASFPTVRFAAVAIKGSRAQLRRMARSRGLSFPVGYDRDGTLAALYSVATCPQVTLAYPGGVVESRALLNTPAPGELRARVAELVAASGRRGAGG
jgi:hypothetical protein